MSILELLGRGPIDLDNIPDEEWELDPAFADLPEIAHAELPPRPDEDHLQDEVEEGLGAAFKRAKQRAFPKAPRGWKAAVGVAVDKVESNAYTAAGMCLRETRQYYGVAARFAAAIDSMRDAASKKMLRHLKDGKAPRGTVVYLWGGGSIYGHIMISIGGGWAISTDWPTNRYGRVRISTLRSAWGYTEVRWSAMVNGVRVWPRKDLYGKKNDPKPKGLAVNRYRVNECLTDEKPISRYERRHMNRVVKALRKKGFSVEGYKEYPKPSLRRAIERFQRSRATLRGDADGLLGPRTCRELGIRSRKGGGGKR